MHSLEDLERTVWRPTVCRTPPQDSSCRLSSRTPLPPGAESIPIPPFHQLHPHTHTHTHTRTHGIDTSMNVFFRRHKTNATLGLHTAHLSLVHASMHRLVKMESPVFCARQHQGSTPCRVASYWCERQSTSLAMARRRPSDSETGPVLSWPRKASPSVANPAFCSASLGIPTQQAILRAF